MTPAIHFGARLLGAMVPVLALGAPFVSIGDQVVVSETGSTRATAYGMSHKILTTPEQIVVGWLDQPANIMVRAFDRQGGEWAAPVQVGTGMSNHAGPALTMDGAGRVHMVFGPHHGPFVYRHTVQPGSIGEWSEPESFGDMGTYPSLMCGPDDTLHLTYRSSGTDPWRVLYQRRPIGGEWSEPLPLFENDVLDYMWTGHSLGVDQTGALHLVLCLYEQEAKRGRAIVYLRSNDGGATWRNTAGDAMALPVHSADSSTILAEPEMDVRVKSLVLDPAQQPWFVTVHLARHPRSVVLRTLEGGQWKAVDLLPHLQASFPARELVDATMTFDRRGTLYVACTTNAVDEQPRTFWGDPSHEVVVMASRDRGKHFAVLPVSAPDSRQPSWMPSIERPYSFEPIGVPHLLYTTGGPGEGVHGGPDTRVSFVTLDASD